jgi:hypothetical protein
LGWKTGPLSTPPQKPEEQEAEKKPAASNASKPDRPAGSLSWHRIMAMQISRPKRAPKVLGIVIIHIFAVSGRAHDPGSADLGGDGRGIVRFSIGIFDTRHPS